MGSKMIWWYNTFQLHFVEIQGKKWHINIIEFEEKGKLDYDDITSDSLWKTVHE